MTREELDAVDLGPTDEELAEEIRLYESRREYERREFAHASKVAMQRIEEEARLREAAKKDVVAAQEVVRRTFRRYQQAMQDGTEGEQKGWREELRTACAQYNVLAGRLTTEAA